VTDCVIRPHSSLGTVTVCLASCLLPRRIDTVYTPTLTPPVKMQPPSFKSSLSRGPSARTVTSQTAWPERSTTLTRNAGSRMRVHSTGSPQALVTTNDRAIAKHASVARAPGPVRDLMLTSLRPPARIGNQAEDASLTPTQAQAGAADAFLPESAFVGAVGDEENRALLLSAQRRDQVEGASAVVGIESGRGFIHHD
jgi:hypothetical protein